MKKILTTSACFALLILCQEQAHAQLKERWKEKTRLSKRDKEIPFSDTTWLIGGDKEDEMFIRRGAFMYRGDFKRSKFLLVDREYLVVKREADEIILKDEEGISRVYRPDERDSSAMDAPARMAENAFPPSPVTQIDMSKLAGNWEAYKRTRKPDAPAGKIDYSTLLKGAVINNSADANGNYGFFATSLVTSGVVNGAYKISIYKVEAPYLYAKDSEGQEHKITVWRASGEELIFSDEHDMAYYCKKF